MAKLTNVKTVDMVNGEITKVAYDGAEYTKVESGEKGDIAVIVDAWGDQVIGEHYFVNYRNVDYDGDVFIGIDKGHYRECVGYERRMNYFRKISAPTLEDRVSEIERVQASLETEVAALKGEKANETIEFEGATYRKVEREAHEGDVVIFRKNTSCTATNGKTYAVLSPNEESNGVRFIGEMCGDYNVYEVLFGRTRETVDVYEAQYVPQEGDVVVVIANNSGSRNAVGDIGKLSAVTSYDAKVNVPAKPDSNGVDGNWHVFDDFRKATPAEVEAYEKAAHKASFAVGDYVKVVKSERGKEGEIVKITKVSDELQMRRVSGDVVSADFHAKSLDGELYGLAADQIVKATDAEIAEATAPKLKAGDYIKWTDGSRSLPNGEIFEVFGDEEGLHVVDNDGDKRWSALKSPLFKYEILSAEEVKWAKIGRKVNEFKKGDVVRVVKRLSSNFAVGILGIVMRDEIDDCCRPTTEAITTDGKLKSFHPRVELVAPVESLFNANA